MTQRTPQQNKALHKYLELVAEEMNRNGITMQDVVKAIKRAEIRPTKESLKEVVWKPLQEIILAKKSTTELEKTEIDEIYEVMNKWLGQEFEIHIPFPTHDDTFVENFGTKRDWE
jgi:hypothetical protein